jgi:hypothetical protein
MDLSKGFQIEDPQIFIPWGISETQLEEIVGVARQRRVTDGYRVMQCVSLTGLTHKLGFHFEPRAGGRLVEFEFFDSPYPYGEESFTVFQSHLESTFGAPTETQPGTEGFPSHYWRLNGADVWHRVVEHFGPAERVVIRPV